MSLKQKLSDSIKSSMKSGNKSALSFGRNLHAAIRKKEIDDRVDLDDSGVEKIVSTLVKQRQESISQFEKGGREDLVAKEKEELSFLMQFLPEQLSESDLQNLIQNAIQETQANNPKDMGKVMRALLPQVQGKADGKIVSQMVQKALSGQ